MEKEINSTGGFVCHVQVLTRFSSHGNSIYNIEFIYLKKKKNVCLYVYFLAHKVMIMQMHISNPLEKT